MLFETLRFRHVRVRDPHVDEKAASQPIVCIHRMWPCCVLVDIAVTLPSTWRRRRKHTIVLLSGTHVESGESRSLRDEDLVADGIR